LYPGGKILLAALAVPPVDEFPVTNLDRTDSQSQKVIANFQKVIGQDSTT
jgi:hypothetical protein